MASVFPFALYFDSPVSMEEIIKEAEEKYGKQEEWMVEYKTEKWLQEHSKGWYVCVLNKLNF